VNSWEYSSHPDDPCSGPMVCHSRYKLNYMSTYKSHISVSHYNIWNCRPANIHKYFIFQQTFTNISYLELQLTRVSDTCKGENPVQLLWVQHIHLASMSIHCLLQFSLHGWCNIILQPNKITHNKQVWEFITVDALRPIVSVKSTDKSCSMWRVNAR